MLNFRNKSVIFLLLFSCIIILPVYSQETQPTPTPRPSTNTILTEVSEAVDRIGIFNFVSAGLIIIAGIGLWLGLKPLIQHGTDANKRADEVTNQMIEMTDKLLEWHEKQTDRELKLDETRRLQAESLRETANSLKGTVQLVSEIETRKEALERSNTQVDSIKNHTSSEIASATETINAHTDASVGSLKQVVEQAVTGIGEIKEQLQDTVKVDDLETILSPLLKPIVDKLDKIANQLNTAAHKEPVAVEANIHLVENKEEKTDE